MKRKLLAVILTLGMIISLLPAAALAAPGETFVATTKDYFMSGLYENTFVYKILTVDEASGTGTVQVGTGEDGDCTAIPEGVDKPVMIIIPKTVTYNGIEYTVTTIGKNAFARYGKRFSVCIYSNELTEICDNAFAGCTMHPFLIMTKIAPTLGNNVFLDSIIDGYYILPDNISQGYDYIYGWPAARTKADYYDMGERYGYRLSQTIKGIQNNNDYYMLFEDELLFNGSLAPEYDTEFELPSEVKGYPVTGMYAINNICYKKLIIPDHIKYISESYGLGSYYGASPLEIELTGDNPSFVMEDGVLFNKEKTMLIRYLTSNTAESYTVPDTVTTIAGYAFYDCDNLKNITFNDNLNYIGRNAFEGCVGLTDLYIPDGVKNIKDAAFLETNLQSISLPGDVGNFTVSSLYFDNDGLSKISNVTIRDGKPLVLRKRDFTYVGFNPFKILKGYKNLMIDYNDSYNSSHISKIYCQYMSLLHQYAILQHINYALFDVVPTVDEYSDLLDVEIITEGDIRVTVKCKQGKSFDLSRLKLYKAEYTQDGKLYYSEAATTEISDDGTLTLTVSLPKPQMRSVKLMLWDENMQPVTKTMNGVYLGPYVYDPSYLPVSNAVSSIQAFDSVTYIWEFE